MAANILDVTLRDGSYEVDFKFSQNDVKKVGSALQDAGIRYIELGHGQGLNASSATNGIARCTDEEYLIAAQETLQSSKFGCFCIPGIARITDLDLLHKYGGNFVRIGTNTSIDAVKESKKFIEHAKELGLEVFSNYMKTYVADDKTFEECVKLSESYGADHVVIVDSAGCMFTEDIKRYFDVAKNISKRNIGVGFHGHDNLGLSIANTEYAAMIGCDFVDTSLQSLGRGAGNASTEQFIAILQKKYNCDDYSLAELMAFSEEYLRPIVKFKGVSGLDTYCGIAEFHSGFMPAIREIAAKYNVSKYDLIVEYSKIDKVGMQKNLLENIAEKLLAYEKR